MKVKLLETMATFDGPDALEEARAEAISLMLTATDREFAVTQIEEDVTLTTWFGSGGIAAVYGIEGGVIQGHEPDFIVDDDLKGDCA